MAIHEVKKTASSRPARDLLSAKRPSFFTIGIDEVGRGALAGPVVVVAAAVMCPPRQIEKRGFGALKDSKKLSANQREMWYARFLANPHITFGMARVYPREIERRNISAAANLAAKRAFVALTKRLVAKGKGAAIFLDGGLYIGSRKWQADHFPKAKTAPKSDENIQAVKIASIIAKVLRDRAMGRLSKKYPGYGLEIHKGYGTAAHRAAIVEYGPCEIHRLTFLSKSISISK